MEALTAAEMRATERAAIDSGAATGGALMARAGAACVAALPALGLSCGRAAVLCGPGGNGGDGYVIARLLAQRGWRVEVFALGDPAHLPPDAAANHARWRALGPVRKLHLNAARGVDLVVDALFGAGLSRDLDLTLASVSGRVLAVDGPSGLCLDTGRDRGVVAPADLTVSFHRAKRGHYLRDGPASCGRLLVADIGLSDTPCGALRMAAPAPQLVKSGAAHKYGYGHALMLSGGPGRGGAARIAARAALRAGAGLVTLGASGAAMLENAAHLDAVMLRRVDGPEGLRAALEDHRLTALGLGPGMGPSAATREMVLAGLDAAGDRPALLDADALSAFAADPAPLFAACRDACVAMTPHDGEFARLFPDLAEAPRVEATAEAASRAGAAMLRKGPASVIAAPHGALALSAAAYGRAAPQLATAGSGDALAGIALGALAMGLDPFRALESAAWLHLEAACAVGPGLIAEDIAEALPLALRAISR